jgi:hypothetical protein
MDGRGIKGEWSSQKICQKNKKSEKIPIKKYLDYGTYQKKEIAFFTPLHDIGTTCFTFALFDRVAVSVVDITVKTFRAQQP